MKMNLNWLVFRVLPLVFPRVFLVCLAVFCLNLKSEARADFLLHPWENRSLEEKTAIFQRDRNLAPIFSIIVNPLYFTSSSNFAANGDRFSLASSSTYNRVDLDLIVEGQISPGVGLFGRLTGANSQLESRSLSKNRWSLLDQTIGVDVHLLNLSGTSFNLQVQADFPGYPKTVSGDLPVGDHSFDLTSGLFANIPLWSADHFTLSGIIGAGYTYRTENYSAAVPWSAVFHYRPRRAGLSASWMMSGIVSLNTDQRSAATPSHVSLVSGGINPNIIQAQGKIGYQFEPAHEISFAATQSIWGQEVPNGTQISFAYQYRILENKDTNPVHLTPREFSHSNAGFLTYSLDAHILNINDRLNLVKINKGREDGVDIGQVFDIFKYDMNHKIGEPVARGIVSNVRLSDAAIEIIEYYKEVPIDPEYLVKRLVR